jgi:hypothetical protein
LVNLDFGAKQRHDGTTDTTIHQSARARLERGSSAIGKRWLSKKSVRRERSERSSPTLFSKFAF